MVPGNTSFWSCGFCAVDKLRSGFAFTSFCISVFGVEKLENKASCQPLLAGMCGARPRLSVPIPVMA